MQRLTPQQFQKKFKALHSCVEAVDWIGQTRAPDFATAWRGCDLPQWMCWLAVRLVSAEGVKAVLACARAVALHAEPKLTIKALDLAQALHEGKASDLEALRVAAFDCAEAGIHPRVANGSALMAVSYACHTVLQLKKAASLPEQSAERHKAALKAAHHAADALFHAIDANPKDAKKLAQLVRSSTNEAVLERAWERVPV